MTSIYEIRIQTFKSSTILNVFRKTNLVSYNSDVVITKLFILLISNSKEDNSKLESILNFTITFKKIQDITQFVEVI